MNLLSSTLSALVNQAQAVVGAGAVPRAMGNAHPSIAPYETLPTADGVLVLAVGNDRQFGSLCEVLGLELAGDPDFATNPARVANRPALAAILSEALATGPTADWVEELTAAGVPAGPVNDIPAALELATTLGLDPVVPIAGVPTVANPITLSRTPVDYRLAPPGPHPGTWPWLTSTAHRPPRRPCSSRCAPGSCAGTSPPDRPVRQEDLAASLGVSRVPVREALRILESEGHVTYIAHRGYRVDRAGPRRPAGALPPACAHRGRPGPPGPHPPRPRSRRLRPGSARAAGVRRGRAAGRPGRDGGGQSRLPLGDPAPHSPGRADPDHAVGRLRGVPGALVRPQRQRRARERTSTSAPWPRSRRATPRRWLPSSPSIGREQSARCAPSSRAQLHRLSRVPLQQRGEHLEDARVLDRGGDLLGSTVGDARAWCAEGSCRSGSWAGPAR